MSLTFTIHLWWLWAYLLLGLILWLPLNWLSYSQIHNPSGSFWQMILGLPRKRGWWHTIKAFVIQVTLWPAAIWELAQ